MKARIDTKVDKNVRCDACGCAFVPEMKTQREGEIEFTFFNCDYCGKAYMVGVTDEALRKDIGKYTDLAKLSRMGRLNEAGHRRAIQLKESNLRRGKELRKQYLKEAETNGENGGST